MNYFHPFATCNAPADPSAVAARGRKQSYPGGGDKIAEYHPYVGGGQPNPYSPYSTYGGGGHPNPYSPYSPYAGGVGAYTGGQPSPYTHYSPYSSHSPYPPMPALGSGQVHNLPGAENWFSPSGVPRQIAPIDERVPLASKPMNQYSYQQNDADHKDSGGAGVGFAIVAADELVELKKPRSKSKPKSSKGRTRGGSRTKKKSGQCTSEDADDGIIVDAEGLATLKKPTSKTASTTTRRSRAKSSADGFRTPAKSKTKSSASRTSSARAKSTDGFRTPTDLQTSTSANSSSVLRTPATDIGPNWTIECVERGDWTHTTSHKKKGQYYKYWHSPGGHKFRSKVEVGVFKDALVKLEGTDHEGDEDIAREMAKQALCNKDVNGGLVITDVITNDAIEMAKDGDLASARGHCIIVKRTCLTPGCTRHRKTDGMCRRHYEEEKKRGKSAEKSTKTNSPGRSRSPTPRRCSRTITNDITDMNARNENTPIPRRRRPSTLANDSVKPNGENVPPSSRHPSTPFAGDIVEMNSENTPPCHGPDAFVGETFVIDGDAVPPLPPPHLSPIEDVSVDDHEDGKDKDDKIINEDAGKNGLGVKDDVSKEDDGGQYFGGDDESFGDGMPLLDDGSPVTKVGGNDTRGNALNDSDFFRLIDSIPSLPSVPTCIDDITVSSLGSFKEEVNTPSSPPQREIVESGTELSPLPKSSPLKEANSRTQRVVIEDEAYVETITGPISEYGQHLDWVDEEKNNLRCNRLDWGEVEGTPTPPKRTPTANSLGRMLQQKQSTRRGTRSQSAARRRPSPARGERLSSDGDGNPIYYYNDILRHQQMDDGAYKFQVEWNTGEITWEPAKYLQGASHFAKYLRDSGLAKLDEFSWACEQNELSADASI